MSLNDLLRGNLRRILGTLVFNHLPACFCPFWSHQYVPASVPADRRTPPPPLTPPSARWLRCSSARPCGASFSDSSCLGRAAAPARASSPRRVGSARQTAARPDSLPLSARGPGVSVGPGNRSPTPPHPGTRIGSKPPHLLPLCRLFISCSHQEVRTE